MIALIVVLVVLLIAAIYWLVSYILSGTIVYLNRQPLPKNPGDYGMDYENISFETSDGVTIKGWLIKGSGRGIVVMTHVGGLTRYGSTTSYRNLTKLYNREVQFLKTAAHLNKEGYRVLMFDLRNHGESGPAPNKGMAAVGLEEYRDVAAAMVFISKRDDLRDLPIGFVSFCMGANSTIIAMSKEPAVFNNVKCLMAVQPISMEVFVRKYAGTLLTPWGIGLLMPGIKKCLALRGARPLEQMSPAEYVRDLKVPVLYVQARNDPWTELNDIRGFFEDTPDNPKEFYWIENTIHRFESYSYFEERPEKMLEWVKKWV
ncbi:MAG: alpha/beta hydrolase [Dehalococcoidales bacterium]|nr:alpha/beta hydrolase [Dehalococcoidales bacterium]